MKKIINRRNFVISTLGCSLIRSPFANPICDITPSQPKGPFYKKEYLLNSSDMTSKGKALGEKIQIEGRVLDKNCTPQPLSLIKIWQANSFGKYNHKNDFSKNAYDPNFSGYNKIYTNNDGFYKLITIYPGSYIISKNIIRPPHIHILVKTKENKELVTQIYFKGHPNNKNDVLYKRLKMGNLLEVKLSKLNNGIRNGVFDIVV